MTGNKPSGVQIAWYQVAITERFSSVLYPLDVWQLLREITDIAYVVPNLLLSTGQYEAGKPIAVKGDIELILDQDKKTIGVKGRDPEKVVESFQELRDFYTERLDPSSALATHYVEFEGQGWARGRMSPIEVCSRFWANCDAIRNLGALLDAEVANFGIQLVPPEIDPNGPEWFHVAIAPLVPSSSSRYHVAWVWRGADIERLLKRFSRVNQTLQSLVLRLEAQ